MKKVTRISAALLFLLSFIHTGIAQESNYVRTPGYYTLGINAGLAYQSSDVKATLDGWGVGLTLAKNLYYQPNAAFAFDLRGRALYDQSYGLDHFRSTGIANNEKLSDYLSENGGPGYVYQNHKTHHGELALEGVLSFNELRERTNIILALYGGVGIDWYGALTDQKNGDGSIYDYDGLGINSSASRQSIKSTLLNAYDGKYETKAQGFGDAGNVAIMPAVGVELGYQLTPRFSIGLGHKLTFTGNDDFDGQLWNNDNTATDENDWHHYTNLHLRWILDKKDEKIKPPVIEVRNPEYSPFTTTNPRGLIRAKIKNINSAMDIDYKVNGQTIGFDFAKGAFNNALRLRPGRNEIYIRATNEAGYDEETVIIFLEDTGIEEPPVVEHGRKPRTNFTNPASDTETVYTNRYEIEATVLNVNSRNEIRLSMDGTTINDFDFDSRYDRVTANVRLKEGNNNLKIRVSNRAGSDQDEACVVYKRKQDPNREPPLVRIISPSEDPHTTYNNRITIKANIQNVDEKLNVTYKVNNRRIRNFDFDGLNFSAKASLKEGKNTIEITGRNSDGKDSDQTIIFYHDETEPGIDPPTVNINRIGQPSIDPFNPDQCKISVKAIVTNIDNEDDVKYYLDGNRFYNFTYDKASNTLSSVLTVTAGDHDVRIVATNAAGSDEDTAEVNSCTGNTSGDKPVVDITTPNKSTSNTSNKTASIKADLDHVNSKSDISFKLNGRNYTNFSYDSRRGKLTATVNLVSGNNTIKITGSNQYGQDSDEVNIMYTVVEHPKLPPTVSISKPRNNSTTQSAKANVEAKITNVSSKRDITLKVNGRTTSDFKFDTRRQKLTASVNLVTGNNTILVTAKNKDGSDQDQVNVTYKKLEEPKRPPTVSISKPRNNSTTQSAKANVEAKITNVSSKRDITLKVNGRTTSDFKFDTRRQKLTASVNLVAGNNTILVTAKNKDGSDQDQVNVNYKKLEQPKRPPVVNITKPKNNSTSKVVNTNLEASVTNVSSKRDITVKLNGKSTTDFTFDTRSKKVKAKLTLRNGSNTIEVSAKNKDGSDKDQVKVKYTKPKPAPKPTVKITTPRDGSQVTKSKVQVKATVKNVSSKSDIVFKLNGRTMSSFSYNAKRNLLTATVNLKDGNNKINIEASNSSGKASDEARVAYKAPTQSPAKITAFSVSQPSVDPFDPDKAKCTVKATLANVTSKSQIKLYLNGKRVKSFTYDTSSKKVNSVLNITSGTSNIKLVVTNNDGSDERSDSVSF